MKYGTLLVIDDNPSILTALKICLGNTFERILTLSRPDTAPTLLQQEQVDLILLDMNFSLGVNSGQDGLLWLRTFRRLHAHIPVVLITAFADVQLAIKNSPLLSAHALRLGCTDNQKYSGDYLPG